MTGARNALELLVDRVERNLDAIVERSVEQVVDQVAAYRNARDEGVRADLRANVAGIYRVILTAMRRGRSVQRGHLVQSQAHAERRVRQGISLFDFLHAFRICQVSLWESIVAECDPQDRAVAIPFATHVMHAMELVTSHAASTYIAAQQTDLAHDERLRRDLVEDLLSGDASPPGERGELARNVGLLPGLPLVVTVATPVQPLTEGQDLRAALWAVRAVAGTELPGVAVVRHDEVVGISPASQRSQADILTGLRRAQSELERRGLLLAVGTSPVRRGLAAVPRAYQEAVLARAQLNGRPGVMSLAEISAIDYLVHRVDAEARSILLDRQSSFFEEDSARGGELVETVRAYVNANFNARAAATELRVHPNTVYSRLERIGQLAGIDTRIYVDVINLDIAARLANQATHRS